MAAPQRQPLTLGPGSLIFGPAGGTSPDLLDVSCQVTSCRVNWETNSEDDQPTLCGRTVAGERNYSATLAVTLFQDDQAAGVVDWTWTNKGTEQPFTFIPDDGAGAAEVNGTVVVSPVSIGGEVRKRNTSETEMPIVGDPVFTPAS